MIEPCGNQAGHPAHHYIAADWNGYLCEGVSRADTLERQLAATVDELTEAQTENNRLSAELDHARNVTKSQDDELTKAQAAREQAEAQRDRALEQLTAEQAAHQDPATSRAAPEAPEPVRPGDEVSAVLGVLLLSILGALAAAAGHYVLAGLAVAFAVGWFIFALKRDLP